MAFDPTAAYGRIDILQTLKRPRPPSPPPSSPSPPPRPATPEPIDTLPESMRRIAELIGSGDASTEANAAAPTNPTFLPMFQMPPLLNATTSETPVCAGPIPPDPHSGVLREDGGIRGWLQLRTRVAL